MPTEQQLLQWHQRLGHLSFRVLEKLFPTLFQQCIEKTSFCDACEFAKHSWTSYSSSNDKSIAPFRIVHSNVWGPSWLMLLFGFQWFVTFIDCYSCTTWVYLLHSKMRYFLASSCSIKWYVCNLMQKLRFWGVMMAQNI